MNWLGSQIRCKRQSHLPCQFSTNTTEVEQDHQNLDDIGLTLGTLSLLGLFGLAIHLLIANRKKIESNLFQASP